MAFTLRRTPAATRYYTEPLTELADAISLQMLLIPGGSFTMGSPEDELKRLPDEGLQHDVTISQFFMGRYPITQAQWRLVA
ncbi:MAG: SUMF1/EgtB/PvdO family nonheme iron enzyme, partial [Cyanobacteria bacterium J06636_28]